MRGARTQSEHTQENTVGEASARGGEFSEESERVAEKL